MLGASRNGRTIVDRLKLNRFQVAANKRQGDFAAAPLIFRLSNPPLPATSP
jgi:hypothetical protein